MAFENQYTNYNTIVHNKKKTNIIVKNSQISDNKRMFRKEALTAINKLLKT